MNRKKSDITPSMEPLMQLVDDVNALGAIEDDGIASLLYALLSQPDDKEIQQTLEEALTPYRLRHAILPDPLRPYPGVEYSLDQGEIDLGIINESNLPWRLPLHALPHTTILGTTGGGKTNTLYNILKSVHGRVPCLFISHKENDARLLADPPILDYAYRFDELHLSLFNPPPGENPRSWHQNVIEILCTAFLLQYSRTLLYEGCDTLLSRYDRHNQQQGTQCMFTPSELKYLIAPRKTKYTESATTILDRITRSTNHVFECAEGYSLSDLFLQGSVHLDISGINNDAVAKFIVEWLIEWLYVWHVHNSPNDGQLRFLLILDDAHRFLSKRSNT